MAAEYMHIGIPITNKKPNMMYNEWRLIIRLEHLQLHQEI